MGEAPEHIVLIENEADVDALEVADPSKVAYISQTTLSVEETRAIIARLRERFPAIIGPRTDDICYATTNRQAAVKQLARECDLVLVIGSRNSSNSNRLVEVAREHGAESHLIDNEGQVREEWLEDKRVVGITSGASAPEELVQRLVAFFQARGRRRCAGAPGRAGGRALHAPQDDSPRPGRRLGLTAGRARCARSSSPTCTSGRAAAPTCLRDAEPRDALVRRWRGVDRLVLLGDVLELRQGPLRDGPRLRRAPVLREIGAALGPSAEVVIVAGNHDHDLLAPWLGAPRARARPGRRSGSSRRWTGAPASRWRAWPAGWPRPAVRARYPGRVAARGRLRHPRALPRSPHDRADVRAPGRGADGADLLGRLAAPSDAPRTTRPCWPRCTPGSTRWPQRPAVAALGPPSPSSQAWRALNSSGRRHAGGARWLRGRPAAGRRGPEPCRAGPLPRPLSAGAAPGRLCGRSARWSDASAPAPRHVIFGHTHRAGPLPGDQPGRVGQPDRGARSSTPAAGCTRRPSWAPTRRAAPTARASPSRSTTRGARAGQPARRECSATCRAPGRVERDEHRGGST